MQYEESELWKSLLASRPEDQHADTRLKLAAAFRQFRDNVKPVAEEIALSVPGYTNHGISHCDSLWDTASKLIGVDVTLNPAEAFVLGGAFLIHDLGMGLSAYPGGLIGITSSSEWLDTLARLFPRDFQELQRLTLRDIAANPTWNGLTEPRVKAALTTYLRLHHAEQAGQILSQAWQLTNGETNFLLPDAKLRNWYGKAIGRIARSHWQDVSELPAALPEVPMGAPGDFPSDWSVDELKLACLLRLADAAQIDDRRADILLTTHRQPQGDSLAHWQFQERLMSVQVIDHRLFFSSTVPFPEEMSDAWWTAFDAAQMIDRELRKVDNLCADLKRPRFAARGVAGADSSLRFSSFVQTDGWKPLDAAPYIGDPNSVISRLGGEALYGQHQSSEVPLRELIANALDATRAYRLAFEDADIKPIIIDFDHRDEADFIRVQDRGIGMNESDITERLCNFGTSGWKSDANRSAFPGLLSHGYEPVGQFGIGFFSVFMIADSVKVITRHVDAAKADTLVLEFAEGLVARPMLRPATRSEQLLEQGTKIELRLKKKLTEDGGFFAGAPRHMLEDPDFIARKVRMLALMADESIDIRAVGSSEAVRCIRRNQWLTDSSEEIFDALNPGRDESLPGYVAVRARFAQMLKPIVDSQGKEVGRIGVDALTMHNDESSGLYFQDSAGYCGGLHSSYLSDIVGVLSGSPVGAARKEIKIDVDLPQMQNWYSSQIQGLTAANSDPFQLLRVQRYGISLGIVNDELPLAVGDQGVLHPPAIRNALSAAERVILLEETAGHLPLPGREAWGFFTFNDFALLEHDFLVVPYGPVRFGRLHLPRREDELAQNFDDHTRLHQGFDPIMWWKEEFASPAAQVLRMAAVAWDVDLRDLVVSLKGRYVSANSDNRLAVETVSGRTLRVTGLELSRPA